MSDVMNKVTFECRYSVHTPDYSVDSWWNSFNNPVPELPDGFDYNPRNWRWEESQQSFRETTEQEKLDWDVNLTISEPGPNFEEQLSAANTKIADLESVIDAILGEV